MLQLQYLKTKRAYRVAQRLDRKAHDAHQTQQSYGLARGSSFDPNFHADSVIAGLSPRDKVAVTSRPMLAQFVPYGPRALQEFTRGGMDLNKRVALRRTLKAIDARLAA